MFDNPMENEDKEYDISEKDVPNYYQMYIRKAKKFKLLNKQQEHELADKIKSGCFQSRQLLFNSNLLLVVYLAIQYKNRYTLQSIQFEDLIQIGNEQLWKCTLGYTKDFDTRFSTYAVTWINSSFQYRCGKEDKLIRLPVQLKLISNSLLSVSYTHNIDLTCKVELKALIYEKYRNKFPFNQVPDDEQLYDLLDDAFINLHSKMVYFDQVDAGDTGYTTSKIMDEIHHAMCEQQQSIGEEDVDSKNSMSLIESYIDRVCSSREAYILKQSFGMLDGEEKSLAFIRDALAEEGDSVTRQRIHQIQAGAMNKLKRTLRANGVNKDAFI